MRLRWMKRDLRAVDDDDVILRWGEMRRLQSHSSVIGGWTQALTPEEINELPLVEVPSRARPLKCCRSCDCVEQAEDWQRTEGACVDQNGNTKVSNARFVSARSFQARAFGNSSRAGTLSTVLALISGFFAVPVVHSASVTSWPRVPLFEGSSSRLSMCSITLNSPACSNLKRRTLWIEISMSDVCDVPIIYLQIYGPDQFIFSRNLARRLKSPLFRYPTMRGGILGTVLHANL